MSTASKTPAKIFGAEIPRNRIATAIVAIVSALSLWWAGMTPENTELINQAPQDAPALIGWVENFATHIKGGDVIEIVTAAVGFVVSAGNWIWHKLKP
jgi:hypothetical protein